MIFIRRERLELLRNAYLYPEPRAWWWKWYPRKAWAGT